MIMCRSRGIRHGCQLVAVSVQPFLRRHLATHLVPAKLRGQIVEMAKVSDLRFVQLVEFVDEASR